MAAFFAPSIATIFLRGILWRGATTVAANGALVLGVAAGTALKIVVPGLPAPLAAPSGGITAGGTHVIFR